jgi:hyperosmotically inducible protein
MTISKRARAVAAAATFALAFAACGPKDADIKMAADSAIAGVPGVTVDVTGGVATISGQFADDAAKSATEAKVQAVKGVKSVVNNATVAPPVVISPDEMLKAGVDSAIQAYSGLTAQVMDGVVTLSGEVKRADLPKVMQALSALQPKKIENKAKVVP